MYVLASAGVWYVYYYIRIWMVFKVEIYFFVVEKG